MTSDEHKMKIKAIAPWFGGKRNLAASIVEELGPHRVYWEPMFGSGAVLFAKPACVMETINDLHGDLTNLVRVIASDEHWPGFFKRVRRTLMAEGCFGDSAAVIRGAEAGDEIDPQRAYHYFVTAWLGRNGVAGTKKYNAGYCLRFTSKGGHAATRWRNVARSIPAWHRRLRGVTILRRNVFDLLPRIEDAKGTAIYVDPPYLGKSKQYLHDFDPADHEKLAAELHRFREARVVLSYYDDQQLETLYPNWTRHTIEVAKAMANQGKRGTNTVRATEVLLINGPSLAVREDAGQLQMFDADP